MRTLRIHVLTTCVILLLTNWASAADIPWGPERSVSGVLDGASSVAVADFNRDGRIDVVSTAIAADTVRISYQEGSLTPSWSNTDLVTTMDQVLSVAAGDVNGDGWPDVVAVQRGSSGAEVRGWLNPNGTGGEMWSVIPVDPDFRMARWVHIADLDGDGDEDILATRFTSGVNTDGEIVWYENFNGGGLTWVRHRIAYGFSGAHCAIAADIDLDGDLDVVGAAYGSNSVSWFENDGTIDSNDEWTETPFSSTIAQAICVHAVDYDGDGDQDIVAVGLDHSSLVVMVNDRGSWTEKEFPGSLDGAYSVNSGDMNGDGRSDLLIATRYGDSIEWWEFVTDNIYIHHTLVSDFDGARAIVPADVDGDGDLDIVAAAEFDDTVVWWENEAIHRNIVFNDPESLIAGLSGVDSVLTADLDHDGDFDIVAANHNNSETVADFGAWTQAGGLSTWTGGWFSIPNFEGISAIAVGDYRGDSDGDLDIVGTNESHDRLDFMINDGDASFMELVGYLTCTGPTDVEIADMNRDGQMDLVVVCSDKTLWWNSDAGEHVVRTHTSPIVDVEVGDVDRDGDMDILDLSPAGGVAWRTNDGVGGSFATSSVGFYSGARSIDVTDVNGDDLIDVVAATDDGVIVWVQDASLGSWTPELLESDPLTEAVAYDIDSDGDQDVVALQDTKTIVWENIFGDTTPDIVFDEPMEYSTNLVGLSDLNVVDLSRDGRSDLVLAADGTGEIQLWRNSGDQFGSFALFVAPDTVFSGQTVDIRELYARTWARAGDAEGELDVVDLCWLTEDGGSVLSDAEVDALVDNIEIYHLPDSGGRTLVASFDSQAVVSGCASFELPRGGPNPSISGFETFAISMTFKSNAHEQDPSAFDLRVAAAIGQYRELDVLLESAETYNLSGIVRIGSSGLIFADGFESGGLAAWSGSF